MLKHSCKCQCEAENTRLYLLFGLRLLFEQLEFSSVGGEELRMESCNKLEVKAFLPLWLDVRFSRLVAVELDVATLCCTNFADLQTITESFTISGTDE